MRRSARTSGAWWRAMKADAAAFMDWLMKQYHGEITAHERILEFARAYVPEDSRWRRTLSIIAAQELQHAAWVGELLCARGVQPAVLEKRERYWEKTLPAIDSFERGAAVAAHAERMRLERIRTIAADERAPDDVRAVFRRILPDEEFHERAFRAMAGDAAMREALANHEAGMRAIALIPEYAVV